MFESNRDSGVPSRRMLVTLAIVAASAGAGFAVGRHPEIGKGAQAATVGPATARGATAAPTHDGSLPDTADTLGQEKLRDEDGAPTF